MFAHVDQHVSTLSDTRLRLTGAFYVSHADDTILGAINTQFNKSFQEHRSEFPNRMCLFGERERECGLVAR